MTSATHTVAGLSRLGRLGGYTLGVEHKAFVKKGAATSLPIPLPGGEGGIAATNGEVTPPSESYTALLALMDHFEGVEFGSKAEANLTAYSIAAALKGGDQGATLNFADGREGAGIGWDLTRQGLGADLAAEQEAKFGSY